MIENMEEFIKFVIRLSMTVLALVLSFFLVLFALGFLIFIVVFTHKMITG